MTPVTFIVIGAAKCGTTSLCDLMGGHPDVYISDPKEPHYFSRLVTYERKRAWYASLFEGTESYRARGEGSTSYTHPHRIDFVVPRIRETIPDCRLIYIVRHPIRRLESDWKMRLFEGRTAPTINEAVETDASLITFGLYWKHLSAYRASFPDDQLLVLFLEDFSEDPERELARAFRHVGVGAAFAAEEPTRPRNASKDLRQEDWLARRIRSLPRFDVIRGMVPESARQYLRNHLTRAFETTIEWDPGILESVSAHFRQDAARLLGHCGKPADFWDL